MTEILVETLAELSLAQIQIVLHSARKAKVIGKGMILKTEETAQHMSVSVSLDMHPTKDTICKAHP
jgi:hypothetical protein